MKWSCRKNPAVECMHIDTHRSIDMPLYHMKWDSEACMGGPRQVIQLNPLLYLQVPYPVRTGSGCTLSETFSDQALGIRSEKKQEADKHHVMSWWMMKKWSCRKNPAVECMHIDAHRSINLPPCHMRWDSEARRWPGPWQVIQANGLLTSSIPCQWIRLHALRNSQFSETFLSQFVGRSIDQSTFDFQFMLHSGCIPSLHPYDSSPDSITIFSNWRIFHDV
jgi:hypothetical protein